MALWLPILLFCIPWADLIRQLSFEWEAREQYGYGWFVPILAMALLWRRWLDRPIPSGSRTSDFLLFTGTICLALASLLPLRVIYEINPDWPLISWLYTFIVVSLTLYAFFLAGGWQWVGHFAFPVSFILVAIVWPYRVEKALIQDLMQVVASLTVELLGWLDIPALQRGNLIELSTGTIGIDEACSGIRSFQSSLMAALLMGELYRLRTHGRMALLACGLALGFAFNVVRTSLLSWQANEHGLQALEKWHDPAGVSIAVTCFFGLWAIAILIRKWTASLSPPYSGPTSVVAHPASSLGAMPQTYLVAVGCWALCSLALTEVWYRSHEIKNPGEFHWMASLPTNNPTFHQIELAPRSVQLLKHDLATTGKWQEPDGSQWTGYFLRWFPRSINSVIMSRIHRPDRCLTAAGMRQVADAGIKYFAAGNLELPFRRYVFEAEGRVFHVFFCQWEDGSEKQMGLMDSNQTDRLRSVLVGRRRVGNQSLELMVSGYATLEEADRALALRLPQLVQPEGRPPRPNL
jgi:exosortase